MPPLARVAALIAMTGLIVSAPAAGQNGPQTQRFPIALTIAEVEYVIRLVDERPVREALELALSLRQQVSAHQQRERAAVIDRAVAEERRKADAEKKAPVAPPAGTTMPSPLVADTDYWAVNTATNTFKVATSPTGSAIDLTTTGSGTIVAQKRTLEYGTTPWRYANIYIPSFATVSSYFSKPVIFYEGAYETTFPGLTGQTSLRFGFAGRMSDKAYQMIVGFKNSDYARRSLNDLYNTLIAAGPLFCMPSQSSDINWASTTGPLTWSLNPGDLFSTPYKTYDAIRNFNAGLPSASSRCP